jgi:hypothetical protein
MNLAKPIGINVGIYEEEQSIYSLREQTEEDKLFQLNDSIRNLLESLENSKKVTTEQQDEN